MAKKKKEFIPSQYQQRIYDFITNGQGNAVIEACAGAGKSYTLVKCIELIDPELSILLTAFNRDIVTELTRKTKGYNNVHAKTMHALGLQMLSSNYRDCALELDEFKYNSFINTNLSKLSAIDFFALSRSDRAKYKDNILKFVEFGRYYLAQTVKDLTMIEDRYDIDTLADEKEVAIEVIEWGKSNLEQIDFTDMVYLPNILNCKPYNMQYDWIMVDEAQDLSVAQRNILLKCRKINTRILFVGDKNQCLYSFSGADPDSFARIKDIPNTISLPLSITYRCADNIVDYAKNIVPTIEKNSDGREGEILTDCDISEVKDGDMILCRNNAPLMKVYVELLRQNKKSFIRGKDIGLNMKNIVKRTDEEKLNVDLKKRGVFTKLYSQLHDMIADIMIKNNVTYSEAANSSKVVSRYDMIKALEILSEGLKTSEELINRINEVFSNRKKDGISLSTVHKAKGLEADNVYIVCHSLMPSKQAKKDWEFIQEKNLMYVAYTRSRNKLGFIEESDFSDFNTSNGINIDELLKNEKLVNAATGRKPKQIDTTNKYVATEIIKHATQIEQPKTKPIVKLENKPKVSKQFNFGKPRKLRRI